jgi:hypothetical protein
VVQIIAIPPLIGSVRRVPFAASPLAGNTTAAATSAGVPRWRRHPSDIVAGCVSRRSSVSTKAGATQFSLMLRAGDLGARALFLADRHDRFPLRWIMRPPAP